ncbi:hypothetical protein KR200_001853, partial [Drosophila serrata]
QVIRRGGSNFVMENLITSCDHNYVDYFRKVPNTLNLYTFRVVKLASKFTIDIAVRVLKTKRVMYKVDNLDGCYFLTNPLMNRVFGSVYKKLIVNGTFFNCPIKPDVYYLRNEGSVEMLPSFHPPGKYQVTMRVKMHESPGPFVMEMLWIYSVVKIK